MESSVVLWSDTRDVQIWSVVRADADDVESLQGFVVVFVECVLCHSENTVISTLKFPGIQRC